MEEYDKQWDMLLNSVMIKNMNIFFLSMGRPVFHLWRPSQIRSLLSFSLDMDQDVMGLEPSKACISCKIHNKLRHLSYVIAAFSRSYYEYSFGVGVLVRLVPAIKYLEIRDGDAKWCRAFSLGSRTWESKSLHYTIEGEAYYYERKRKGKKEKKRPHYIYLIFLMYI